MRSVKGDSEGAMWRDFGLTQALLHMPADSPGRAVIEALLAKGTLTPEEARKFKVRGLRTAMDHMSTDSPGRAAVQAVLARESSGQQLTSDAGEDQGDAEPRVGGRANLLDDIERLVALRERGHLTDQEFATAKRILLS